MYLYTYVYYILSQLFSFSFFFVLVDSFITTHDFYFVYFSSQFSPWSHSEGGGRGSERMTGAGPSVELNCNNSPARWSQLCTFGAGAMRQYATTNIKEYSVYAGLLVNEHWELPMSGKCLEVTGDVWHIITSGLSKKTVYRGVPLAATATDYEEPGGSEMQGM